METKPYNSSDAYINILDLETLEKRPGAVIASIGAVKVDSTTLEIVARFYRRVCMVSCRAVGLVSDQDTMEWWSRQPFPAFEEVFSLDDRVPLPFALTDFAAFLGDGNDCVLYGNGPSFDCALLAAAYRACGMPIPWHYRNERCLRTEKAVAIRAGREWTRVEPRIKHHALHDAEAEAEELVRNVLAHVAGKAEMQNIQAQATRPAPQDHEKEN